MSANVPKKIYIGVSYYPEQWPGERWSVDLKLMKEAGINVIRVAELAWSVMEPEDGRFCFAWLHDFIRQAEEWGMDIVIGTPTETSPRWLLKKHPDIVASDENGHIHGQRGGHCYSSPAFQKYTARLVEHMAKEFADEKAVIGWQIDNELKGIRCTCQDCNEKFRSWLKEKYGTLEKLNEDCGTVFWSQTYGDWDEIELPAINQLTVPVSMILEQSRFASWLTVQHCARQAEILKKYAPHQFVTHNTLGLYPWLNVYDLSRELDFISWDSYPQVDGDNFDVCMCHDLHRGAKRDSYWIMEQKNGYLNYSPYNLAIEPGLVRFWGYQDIARGADGVLFYRWRSGRYSVEQNPNGILKHDGTPRRAYQEVKQLTRELGPWMEELADTGVEAEAAILYSYDEQWALEAHKQYPGMEYMEFMLSYYKELARMGVTVDILEPEEDLMRYKVVIAPCMMMLTNELAEHLKDYVRSGGNLLLTVCSGIKNWSDSTTELPWPGQLADAAGLTVDEFEVFPENKGNMIRYKEKDYRVTGWADILALHMAEPLAVYREKFYQGQCAAAVNTYGEGKLYYIGVMGNQDFLSELLFDILEELSIKKQELPEGVFYTRRENRKHCFDFYLNAGRRQVCVKLRQKGTELVTGAATGEDLLLDGLGAAIVRSEQDA